MFENFANVWTIVGIARDLTRAKPLALRVAGEGVVMFRDADGRAAALVDRCPHRGVALSLGRVVNGVIECPFHGWRFDGAGANCGVPLNPDARREALGALALPAREAGGLLWLYTGVDAPSGPEPSPTLLTPGVTLSAQSVVWRAHWTRVMENMLDMPHLPFVHRSTIGRRLSRLTHARMDVFWRDEPHGGRITNAVDGAASPGGLDYRFPNVMELAIDPPGNLFRLMVACVPETEHSTRLILLTLRDFARSRLLDPLFAYMNARIAREDRAVVESSLPTEVPPPAEEASVRTDAPTLAFRRLYRARLRGSGAAPPPRGAARCLG